MLTTNQNNQQPIELNQYKDIGRCVDAVGIVVAYLGFLKLLSMFVIDLIYAILGDFGDFLLPDFLKHIIGDIDYGFWCDKWMD